MQVGYLYTIIQLDNTTNRKQIHKVILINYIIRITENVQIRQLQFISKSILFIPMALIMNDSMNHVLDLCIKTF